MMYLNFYFKTDKCNAVDHKYTFFPTLNVLIAVRGNYVSVQQIRATIKLSMVSNNVSFVFFV